MINFTWILLITRITLIFAYTDVPCQWSSKTGSTYDLRGLTVTSDDDSCYSIRDGDIPCTPEIEPTYSYVWNFCADVTESAFPDVCNPQKMAAAFQYIHRLSDNYQECNIIGHYDASRDDTYFSLLNPSDPSKGVSMTYQYGDVCGKTNVFRSATIDIQCANVKAEVISATEPSKCQYHLTMNSYYGCPQECPVTANGLCNSHGHCAFDPSSRKPHCYCNSGYTGDACDQSVTHQSSSTSAVDAQIGLMVILLIICLILVGFVGYLALQITDFRKEQYQSLVASSQHDGTEMSNLH